MSQIKPNQVHFTLAVTLLFFASSTQAALFLFFTTPDGTVGAIDEISVWVTLNIDSDFLFDSEGPDVTRPLAERLTQMTN